MHFTDSAARWLQSVESRLKSCSWSEFCTMIHDRFGKDQHELLIRQMFHIRQTSTVAEYTYRFAELVDQLTAYGTGTDPKHFTLRFIDGLKDEIKSAVMIQHPSSWDTASVLARLQEEIVEPARGGISKRLMVIFRISPISSTLFLYHNHLSKWLVLWHLLMKEKFLRLPQLDLQLIVGQHGGLIAELKAFVRGVQKNGPGITNVPHLFSCMCCRK